jgi:hypothetical protein
MTRPAPKATPRQRALRRIETFRGSIAASQARRPVVTLPTVRFLDREPKPGDVTPLVPVHAS